MPPKTIDTKPVYSIVAPVFNEIDCVEEFCRVIGSVMEPLKQPWELIIIDDGSTDGSKEKIIQQKSKFKNIKPIIFARNFGHQIAVTAGLDYSQGEAVIIIDADLQDPPEVILELINKWKEGYEVVYAVRRKREGESWFKLFSAALFYRLIFRITDVKIPLDTGDFRLLDRKIVNIFCQMREKHRFLRGMAAWVGFRQVGVEYDRKERFAGKTKYPFSKMLKLALNAITSFSYFPLQVAAYLGFISAGISIIAIPVVAALRLSNINALSGQATTLIAVLFFGGVQLITLGILGEYIGRIYDEVKGRPLYIVNNASEIENNEGDANGKN
jgi:polyisoprenyl-phosphate glycosyltransferase